VQNINERTDSVRGLLPINPLQKSSTLRMLGVPLKNLIPVTWFAGIFLGKQREFTLLQN